MKLDEIARLAGVSRTTASCVINGKAEQYRISQRTQDKVMAVVRAHNFEPDRQAAALRGGLSRTLGLVVPDLANPSYATLARLLERQARHHGFQLLITCSDDDPQTERELALMLKARRVDALMVASCLAVSDDFYCRLNRELPVVGLDRPLPHSLASVSSENAEACARLTRTLVGPSPERAWLIGAAPGLSISQERERGFRDAATELGASFEISHVEQFDRHCARALLEQQVDTDWQSPLAIVTTAFVLLEGVMDFLHQHLGALPASLRLATFGDHRLLDFLATPVNTMAQDHHLVAEKVMSLTLDAVRGHYRSGHYAVPRLLRQRYRPR
ncbi:catabolite repressor/activator [Oceanimonas sp. MB9]|uniref:catabolite repressor/activator n=1 Tax=Oceanimonas sp. MB9 TaxID=2588453 RepID=UPI0013F5CEC4|nr:catabolite repressor/activator [Oceanimonas sp. MB9]NHI01588.1 Catabolite repressor/activator [Oceanimonas sp. MB9]